MKKYLIMSANILLYLAIYFFAQVIAGGVIGAVVAFTYMARSGGAIKADTISKLMNPYILWIMFFAVIITLPVYILIFRSRKLNFLDFCRFKNIKIKGIGLLGLLGVSVSLMLCGVLNMLPIEKWFPDYNKVIDAALNSSPNILVILLITGILIPIFEEILFRGIIYGELKSKIPVTAAIIIQAALFGIYHMNLLQGMYAFAFGIIFALVYEWFGTIWASVTVHIFINSTSTVLSGILSQEVVNKFNVLILTLSSLFVVGLILLAHRYRIKDKDVEVDENPV
ncbi:MAG TPA: type II CAAX endopeptidase family protein [Clostridia bacterium]